MPASVIEAIWHFTGYLHLPQYLSNEGLHYLGGGHYKTDGKFDYAAVKPAAGIHPATPEPSAPTPFSVSGQASPHGPLYPGHSQIESTFAPDFDFDTSVFFPKRFGHLPAVSSSAGAGIPGVTVTYTTGENPADVIQSHQTNFANDDDVLLGDGEISAGTQEAFAQHKAAASLTLAKLVTIVDEIVPQSASALVDGAGGSLQKVHVQTGDSSFHLTGKGADAPEVAANGTYTDNGTLTSKTGQTAQEQAGQISTYIKNSKFGTANDNGSATSNTPQTAGVSPENVEIHNTIDPDTGHSQTTDTGANACLNAAIITDAGEAYGSWIIEGNYHHTNLIVQINALSNTGQVSLSGLGLAQQLVQTDVLTNEASFSQTPGEIYGNVALGGVPGSYQWHVDYNYGNFVSTNVIEQTNVLGDNDIAHVTASQSVFLATLGSDGQLNYLNLTDLGAKYDLIVIGGDYFKLNAILQVNIVVDDDLVSLWSAGGQQLSISAGNTLLNDAAIVDTGAQSFKALAGSTAADLAQAIADGDTSFSGHLTIGLPGNGTPTFDVLYITGNYYDYNIVSQINVLSDADAVSLNATGILSQSATTGGNTALNAALINDFGTTSDYQYLGGQIYETTTLIQANIVLHDDETIHTDSTGTSSLHPDVVATVAALSCEEAAAATTQPTADPSTSYAASHTDGLAAVMG